jgi:CheY-like chemotaxis protein
MPLMNNPDLILMDILIPKVNGHESTNMIRAHDKEIPIIAMTAKVSEEDKENALAAGINEYITKPYTLGQLKEILIKYLG